MFVLYFFKYAFSSVALKIKNLHNKDPKRFALVQFGLKCFLHPRIPLSCPRRHLRKNSILLQFYYFKYDVSHLFRELLLFYYVNSAGKIAILKERFNSLAVQCSCMDLLLPPSISKTDLQPHKMMKWLHFNFSWRVLF